MGCEHLIDGDGYCEECPATVRALHDRIALLEAALIKIQNPLKAMQDEAKAQGYRINGAMAVQLCDSAAYLKEIASDALRATGHIKDET